MQIRNYCIDNDRKLLTYSWCRYAMYSCEVSILGLITSILFLWKENNKICIYWLVLVLIYIGNVMFVMNAEDVVSVGDVSPANKNCWMASWIFSIITFNGSAAAKALLMPCPPEQAENVTRAC